MFLRVIFLAESESAMNQTLEVQIVSQALLVVLDWQYRCQF